jgi:alpha-D-ribose 1-methylphosphonate 5-triphosphate synthase subunit PhnL
VTVVVELFLQEVREELAALVHQRLPLEPIWQVPHLDLVAQSLLQHQIQVDHHVQHHRALLAALHLDHQVQVAHLVAVVQVPRLKKI